MFFGLFFQNIIKGYYLNQYLRKKIIIMSEKKYQFDTLKVRAGYNSAEHNNSIQVPIYQTAAFDLVSTERAKRILSFEELAYVYTRVGNPTLAALEARVAALDGASAAVSVASGMAAVSYAILNAAERG